MNEQEPTVNRLDSRPQRPFTTIADPVSDPHLNGKYFENNPTWNVEFSPWKANNIYNFLQEKKLNPKTICEVGCGAGEVLKQVAVEDGSTVPVLGIRCRSASHRDGQAKRKR